VKKSKRGKAVGAGVAGAEAGKWMLGRIARPRGPLAEALGVPAWEDVWVEVQRRRRGPPPRLGLSAKQRQAVVLEVHHLRASLRQRGWPRQCPAYLIAATIGVARGTIRRWRRQEAYDMAVWIGYGCEIPPSEQSQSGNAEE
jgi:hypothetical protein